MSSPWLCLMSSLCVFTACSQSDTVVYENEIEPILAKYCYDCHGDGMDKGDVALDEYESLAKHFGDRNLWEGVHNNVEAHLMPPAEKKQPTDDEREKIIAWIEKGVFKLDPKNPDPGQVTIRRLNRDEYNNTVRDLFGMDLRPAESFPEDDTGYGFDNVGDVLSLSPTLMERYLQASAEILNQIIVTEAPKPRFKTFAGDFVPREGGPDPSGSMSSNGKLGAKFEVPADGEYRIQVTASGSPAKNGWPLMRVAAEKGPQKDFTVDGDRERPKQFTLSAKWKKGDGRWIEVSFLNDLYDPKSKDPQQRDRNLYLMRIQIEGPLNQKIPPPNAAHEAIIGLGRDAKDEKGRARMIIEKFASTAWRRPLKKGEADRLFKFYERIRKDEKGTFDQGIKLALQATLVSPHFLFRGEVRDNPNDPRSIKPVDEFALASRLSYFLWSSMPDSELIELAEKKQLRASLDKQITRMLKDPKAESLTKNFAGQWLQLRNLRIASPDPKTYKGWNDELRSAMSSETEQFFSEIVRENRSVIDFLNADYTYLNERLANHYGVPGVKGKKFQRVVLKGDQKKQRGGVLGHASILTITSNPTRTSAVNRGNYVLENLLGTPPPPPPEDIEIPNLEDSGKGDNKNKTLREQLELHREKAICSSCHKRMDPIGFGMENFDGIGRWRDQENGRKIDASGELYTGEKFSGPSELKTILTKQKSEAFVRCLSDKLLTYALGRGTEYFDKPAIAEIATKTTEGGYRFHTLVKAIVDSVPFQNYRGDETSAPQ